MHLPATRVCLFRWLMKRGVQGVERETKMAAVGRRSAASCNGVLSCIFFLLLAGMVGVIPDNRMLLGEYVNMNTMAGHS